MELTNPINIVGLTLLIAAGETAYRRGGWSGFGLMVLASVGTLLTF